MIMPVINLINTYKFWWGHHNSTNFQSHYPGSVLHACFLFKVIIIMHYFNVYELKSCLIYLHEATFI